MKHLLLILFLSGITCCSLAQTQGTLQSEATIKEMICHKWLTAKIMSNGKVEANDSKIKIYMTFYNTGDFTMGAAGKVEKQKWVYDAKTKLIKLIDSKDKSSAGRFKIIKLDGKEMVLFLLEDNITVYLSRVD
jgi:hypothetical protein